MKRMWGMALTAAVWGSACYSASDDAPGQDGAVACVLSSECPAGMYCSAGRQCTYDCREARDCFGRGRCDPASGRCISEDAGQGAEDGANFPADRGSLTDATLEDVTAVDALPSEDALPFVDTSPSPDIVAPIDRTVPSVDAMGPVEDDGGPTTMLDRPSPSDAYDAGPIVDAAGLDATTDAAPTSDSGAGDAGESGDRPEADHVDATTGVDRPDAGSMMCAPEITTTGLWGWWRFDGDLRDSSGAGRHATVSSGVPAFGEGVSCGAVYLDPSRSFVDLPDARLRRMTLSLSVRVSGPLVGGASIFDGWTGSENFHASLVSRDGALLWSVGVHDNASGSSWLPETHLFSTGPAVADRWVNLALTYDGIVLKLYVDGRLDASTLQSMSTYPGTVPSVSDYRLGVDRSGARVFRGAIDELRIYDRALSAAEVAAISGIAPPTCAAGTHRCGDRCAPNDAVATCGDRCDPCPTPPGGVATCEAGACRSTVTLQPGPDVGKDIWTTSVYSYATGGSGPGGGLDDDVLRIGGWGDEYIALLQFDLRGLPAMPTQATLELYTQAASDGSAAVSMNLERITAAWDWRIGGTGRDRQRLWWADRPSGERWGGARSAPVRGDWYRIDLTSLVTAWVGGLHPNYGLQLRPTSTNHTFNGFYSSDHADASRRPRLVIRY